jgi:dihydroxynaphthoic acid synthetase
MPDIEKDDVLYSVEDAIATITINRPRKLNAFTTGTLRRMIAALQEAAADPAVGVVVVTGAGDRAFSAGGDVATEDEEAFTSGADALDELNRDLYRAFRECLKPIIARVNGYAIGGGHHMAYMSDFTIASDKSIFGQNGPRVASPAEGWIVSHLWTVVGMKRAKEIWMLCRRYSAQQALEFGLINAAVPEAELDAEVRKWADELLALSPTVLKLIKRSIDDSVEMLRVPAERGRLLPSINPDFFSSGEQQEGATAFMEKRTPDFSPYR